MVEHRSTTDRLLAIADIVDQEDELIDELEGLFLLAAGRSQWLSPAAVARDTRLSRESATDLFRQLLECGAVERESYDAEIVEARFTIHGTQMREIFDRTREAIKIVTAHRDRVPTTAVTPLVTFPDDPAFSDTTAASFGMDGLLSTLATQVKRCESEIVLLSPFFEGEGLGRLADVLLDALEQGIDLTIVTRYLTDTRSHNYSVIKSFVDRAAERGVSAEISLVDYTVWDDSVPTEERRQNGANPRFTLHAKVMLFDSDAAYVGSANVTDYGFDRYLELGVLLEGAKVAPYRDLCRFLLESEGAVSISL
ncbi:phospholipase D-like domain-containing protein [Halosimplex sp. J119]